MIWWRSEQTYCRTVFNSPEECHFISVGFDVVSKDFIRWIVKYEFIDAILPLTGRQLCEFGTAQHQLNYRSQLGVLQTMYFKCVYLTTLSISKIIQCRCCYERTSVEHCWNASDKGRQKHAERNLSQCHFVHNKSHTVSPRFEPAAPHSRYSDSLRAGRSRDRIPVGDEVFCTRPVSDTVGIGSFPVVKRRKRDLNNPPNLSPRSKKEYNYTSTPVLCLHDRL
jgi:hypothetical protein